MSKCLLCCFCHDLEFVALPHRSLSPKSKDGRVKKEKDIKTEEEEDDKKKKEKV